MSRTPTGRRRFEGCSVVVTGAAGGLGRADCLALASEGAHVWAADIDMTAAEALLRATRHPLGSVSLVMMLGFVWGGVDCDLDREDRVSAVQAAHNRA